MDKASDGKYDFIKKYMLHNLQGGFVGMCKEMGFMAGTTLAQPRRERLFLPLQFGKGERAAESL